MCVCESVYVYLCVQIFFWLDASSCSLIENVLLGLKSKLNLCNSKRFFPCLKYKLCFSQGSTSWCTSAIL